MDLIGKMLNNRYEILEKIGNGGMATVYKAKCHVLNRFVAVKVLRDEFTTDADFIKRFNTEAQSAASLTHPNIVSVYDVGNENNLYYIVMELIQGKTLKEIILEDGVLPWKWSINIAIQIASALETAHKNNIIHRDIKPHNIIITEDGIAKVTDFGIAKAVSNSTITAFGSTIGSVHYFSPEHARGGFTDAKSDIYSLGVVMYEMLTGRVPFDADTPVSVALKQVQEDPIEPIKLNNQIPISVNRIILKAMQKDTNLRYQSATEMLTDLTIALKRPNEDFVVLATKLANSPTQKVPTLYELELNSSNDRKAPKIGDKSEEKEEEKKKGKIGTFLKNHPIIKIFLILILCVAIFLGAMFGALWSINSKRPKQELIPNLAGANGEVRLTKAEAEKLLKELGFEYEIEEVYDDEVLEGLVISQTPTYQANFKINLTEKFKIVVSKGQKMVTIPTKLVGEKIEDVEKLLKEADIDYKKVEEYNEEVEAGIVLSIDPKEGEKISASTKVTVTISKGSSLKDVPVPTVLNKKENDAIAAIEKAGLLVEVEYAEDTSKAEGIVLAQDIEGGTTIKEGSTVTITVNKYAEIIDGVINVNVKSLSGYKEEYEDETNTVLKEPKLVEVKVTVNGVVIDSIKTVKTNAEKISFKFQDRKTVTVEVFIDGARKATKSMNLEEITTLNIE